MNNKFDELTKALAQSTTRRAALRKFGSGITGLALAALGLASKAQADPQFNCVCDAPFAGCKSNKGSCYKFCLSYCS